MLEFPALLCSFKTYSGTAGEAGLALAKRLERVADDVGGSAASLAVAPQTPDIRMIASRTDLPVIAQAADAAETGEGTGDVLVGTLADAGADALFVNHPERPQGVGATRDLLADCTEYGLTSVVCVRDRSEGRAAVELGADCLLFEQPSDVATGDPLVRRDPARVEAFVDSVRAVREDVRVAVGGGVTNGEDVVAARRCGVDAVGVASAVADASDPENRVRELLRPLTSGSD